jgi:hypothetical protein
MFGVAIHHGALPGPFRREIERLLQLGSLKVTIASPTLAQGLNLSASAVLLHGLRRGRDLLKGADFANLIGRAGRAFVDTEGLVLYPIFQPTEIRRREWLELTQGDGGKALQSDTSRSASRSCEGCTHRSGSVLWSPSSTTSPAARTGLCPSCLESQTMTVPPLPRVGSRISRYWTSGS